MAEYRVTGEELFRLEQARETLASGQGAVHRLVNTLGTREFGLVPGGFSVEERENGVFIVPNNPDAVEVEEEAEEEEPTRSELHNELSTRTANALVEAGFSSLSNLHGMTDEEITDIPGVGDSSLEEIREHVSAPEPEAEEEESEDEETVEEDAPSEEESEGEAEDNEEGESE